MQEMLRCSTVRDSTATCLEPSAACISLSAQLQGCTHCAMALQMMLPQSPPCRTQQWAALPFSQQTYLLVHNFTAEARGWSVRLASTHA